MSHKFPKFEHIEISGSEMGSTAFQISTPNHPGFFHVDASSSVDGGSRVIIRNTNDDFSLPTFTSQRGVLHIEQTGTSSAELAARGISMYTYDVDEAYTSTLNLHSWNNNYGNSSTLSLYSNQGTFPGGFVNEYQRLGTIRFGGYDGNATQHSLTIQARADQDWDHAQNNSSYLAFSLVPLHKHSSGAGHHLRERIRMTGEGHLIVFPYSASNDDTGSLNSNYLSGAGSPALQVFGPTKFGSASSDTHQVTGSTILSGSVSFNYINLSTPGTTAIPSSATIVGFNTTLGSITGSLFSAAAVPIGTLLYFKNETKPFVANGILISASGSETIDGAAAIPLSGENDALQMYSNGTNWFCLAAEHLF